MIKSIDGASLASMLQNGYRNLLRNMELINDLNVFPVPDGDTGTNMAMTMGGGIRAASSEQPLGEWLKNFARGTLLSARGNSGVILSQFFHGFAVALEGKETADLQDFGYAMHSGVEEAYRAVLKPAEGTVLTVVRQAASFLHENAFPCFEDCLKALCENMRTTLAETPELLPVLKEAGVVDSGGAGLVCIFEGMEAALRGEMIEETAEADISLTQTAPSGSFDANSVLEYGYCTEFILQLMHAKTDISAFRLEPMTDFLRQIGDSIVAVRNGDIVKIHVHTFQPERVIEYARQFGEFVTFKMENMSVQHNEVVAKQAPPKEKYAVVAVVSGEGFEHYFREIGVAVTVPGGQTQNPSAEDFLKAFEQANAEHIVVLPNNSNIILTAQQAASLYSDAQIHVIPTKSLAEGYSSLSMMDLYADTVDELLESMSALDGVTTGLVTTATRDTLMSGVSVHKSDFIGLADSRICSAAASAVEAGMQMLKALPEMAEKQVLTVFYGKDFSEDELENLQQQVEQTYPLLECGYIYGGQEVYPLIMAIE